MNRDETWELYNRGSAAWNKWADCMLAERERLNQSGEWKEQSSRWSKEAKADFSGREFDKFAPLLLYTFPADVDFNSAIFHCSVDFMHSCLCGSAMFEDTVFKEKAHFGKLRFAEMVSFTSCTFESSADFGGADFLGHAKFVSVRAMDRFDLTEARFRLVPDFSGAQFTHAPRLDGTRFHTYRIPSLSRLWKSRADDSLSAFDGRARAEPQSAIVTNETGRWRALRYHAAEWGDFTNEDRFLVREFIARRQTTMNWWQPRFWASLLYALLSKYGSSFMLPLFWWMLVLAVFAGIYTHYHLKLPESANVNGNVGVGGYVRRCYQQTHASRHHTETDHGIAGSVGVANTEKGKVQPNNNSCDNIKAALGLSLANSLGPLATRHTNVLRNRLFGDSGAAERRSTEIKSEPYVIATEVFQAVLSFVLLFLFALSLRRQFRVR